MAYIRKICQRIAKEYQPKKIILFGSHAYGRPTPESDVDLLVVMDFEGRPFEQSLRITNQLGIVTPVDLLIRTPKEVEERLHDGDMFMREILEHGKVMYEA
jgi:predicted nucleotidyltransferase